jgi:hypothetical protein
MVVKTKILSRTLFFFILLTEVAMGYYACHIKGFVFGDGISRVASAFYVFYIHPPHLAAIGTTWNPLPSFLELPLMLLWPIYKPIASSGLAGVIMTAVFAAGSAVLIYKGTLKLINSHSLGVLLALLYSFNPFMFVYGFSGKAEIPFCFMLLWFTYSFINWIEDSNTYHVAYMAIALALAFLIRYEVLAVSVAAFLGLAIIILTYHRKVLESGSRDSLRYNLQKIEGRGTLLLTPMIYALICWILYDWLITGNPLYFLNSTYSNLGFTRSYAANATLNSLVGNPAATLHYVYRAGHYFFIPLVVILAYRLVKGRLFKWDLAVLLLLIGSTLAQQVYMLFKGLSAGAVRYFIYPLPVITAWFPYEIQRKRSKIYIGLFLSSFLFADVYLGHAWFKSAAFRDIQEEVTDITFSNVKNPAEDLQREVAKYINSNLADSRILMDSVRTYNVILNTNHPGNIVTTCSYDFKAALNNPRKKRIGYILIPSYQNDFNRQDAVNNRYPQLYERGAKWCVLAKEFGQYYRLYRVVGKKNLD